MSKLGDPVDYVLDRMVEAVLGENAHYKSHAEALNIPANTIKTWKRRREVPSGYLANFAADWKVSVDWLLHGGERAPAKNEARGLEESKKPYDLSKEEMKLLANYRSSPHEVQEALQIVASIASRPALDYPEKPQKVPCTKKMRCGGPVDKVAPVMRSGEVSKAGSARKRIKKGGNPK